MSPFGSEKCSELSFLLTSIRSLCRPRPLNSTLMIALPYLLPLSCQDAYTRLLLAGANDVRINLFNDMGSTPHASWLRTYAPHPGMLEWVWSKVQCAEPHIDIVSAPRCLPVSNHTSSPIVRHECAHRRPPTHTTTTCTRLVWSITHSASYWVSRTHVMCIYAILHAQESLHRSWPGFEKR